ncbi:MAG: protease family protein [Chloroflexota bacterium]|nr:protease family protein [Chloroflexota bacterium]
MTSDDDPDAPAPPPRPGASIFTIEGRAAPALFVVGWLASLMGLALVIVGAVAGSGPFLYFVGPTLLTVGLVAGSGSQAIERRVRGMAYAGPSPYLVFAAAIAAIYAVGSVVGVALHLLLGPTLLPSYVVRLIGVTLQAAVFIGIVRLTVVDSHALSWPEMGWHRPDAVAIRDLVYGGFVALPIIGLTALLAAALVQLFQVVPEAPLPPTGLAVGLAVQLLAGAVIAPIAEETVFRGFAISAWQRTVGVRGAIIRASLLFALAHVLNVSADNAGQAAGLIVVGFVTRLPVAFALGWLFVARRSIWAPLGLHIAFNAILLVLGEIAGSAAG